MKTLKIIAVLFLTALTLNAQTFQASGDNRNQATFESNAPLEDIVGVSNEVEAAAMINPADLSHAMGKVSVNLNVLKTGIDLRDEHLRGEMWLNTAKFPNAEFKLNSISGATYLTDSKATNVKLHGTFTVHGVSKDLIADGQLTYFKESERTKAKMAGNLLKVKANFEIKLSDYGVMIPAMVVGKLDENIKVSVAFIATDAGSKMAGNP
ncbi:MAG: YceI family protein, partial [Melioribacteraceae bacterium]|nr:YceI family protein [Melioribacteraceae bacterium]